jgi:hypothetical protein
MADCMENPGDIDAPLNPVEFAELLGRCYYTGPFAATEASLSEAQRAYIVTWAQLLERVLAVTPAVTDDAVRTALDEIGQVADEYPWVGDHLATLVAALADRERECAVCCRSDNMCIDLEGECERLADELENVGLVMRHRSGAVRGTHPMQVRSSVE